MSASGGIHCRYFVVSVDKNLVSIGAANAVAARSTVEAVVTDRELDVDCTLEPSRIGEALSECKVLLLGIS